MILDGRKLELAGRAAYEAYRIEVQGRSVRGEPLPTWSAQEERIRVAWRMAADAAVMVATGPQGPLPSRWQPVGRYAEPQQMISGAVMEPGVLYAEELPPQVDAGRAAEAHGRAPVVADDSDGDELPVAGADGCPASCTMDHDGRLDP